MKRTISIIIVFICFLLAACLEERALIMPIIIGDNTTMTPIMWGCLVLGIIIIAGIVWFIYDGFKNPDRLLPF